jgi:NitT/TauT family transport system substrate-binding protein
MPRFKRTTFVVCLLVIVVAACGGDTTEDATTTTAGTEEPEATTTTASTEEETTTTAAAELPVVRLSALSGGLTAIAQLVVQENGFDVANGFQGEYFYNDPDASGQFFLQRNSDIAFDFDSLGAAIARSQDINVSVFYPILNNNNCILVQSDSEYETVEDLAGQRVGHFGADSGTTTSISTILSEFHGMNVFEDFELVETGPPALVELLGQGEVEAIFDFVPHFSRAIVEADARCLLGPINQYLAEQDTGLVNHLSAMTAYDDWLAENESLALMVMAAWDDAIAWITEDPVRITEGVYAEALAQDNPDVLALIAEQVTAIPLFTNEWGSEVVEGAEAWVDLAAAQGILIDENPGGVHTIMGG